MKAPIEKIKATVPNAGDVPGKVLILLRGPWQPFIRIGAADPAIAGFDQQTSLYLSVKSVLVASSVGAVAKRKTYTYSIINYLLGFIQFGSLLNRLQIGCGRSATGLIMKVYYRIEKRGRGRVENSVWQTAVYEKGRRLGVAVRGTGQRKVMSSFGEVIHPDEIAIRHSKNEKYLSITFEIVARSREYIEQIYSELNAQNEVKMML